MDGKSGKLHLSMVFPALLGGIHGLSVWMQIKWMGKINTLKLKSEFPECTSQPSLRCAGSELQAPGAALDEAAGRILSLSLFLSLPLSAPALPCSLPISVPAYGHRCHRNFYVYLKPSSEKLSSF